MKILFLMYSWDRIDPEVDSTLRLIHEAAARQMTVAVTTAHNLTIRDNMPYAFCNVLRRNEKLSNNVAAFYKSAQFSRAKLPLAGFDVIIMRSNPPLDNIALNFLDSVRNDVLIMNDIDGLRIANNKLYPFHSKVKRHATYQQRTYPKAAST